MKYGSFSNDGREYIITNVATPKPWINYIYNKNYFSTISQNAGSISYYKSPLHGRITRYRINDVPYDRPGKYIYLKDKKTGDYWSLSWQPTGKCKDCYKAIHGFGYTKLLSNVNNISSEVLYFVPLNDDLEIWRVTLENKNDFDIELEIYSYVEFALGHALIDLINQCDDQHFNRVYFERDLNTLFATKTYWVTQNMGTQQQENQEWDRWAFFTSSLTVKEYETLRERFIGVFRNENNPEAIEKGLLSSKDTDFGNAIGGLKSEINLKAGEKKEFVIILGVLEKARFDKLKNSVTKYYDINLVDKAYAEVLAYWDNWFSHIKVDIPDRDAQVFMNYWNQYQAKVAFDVGRVASFYYWGIGRGFGFRDTSQDTIATLIAEPQKAKERIFLLSRQMFKNGKVYHHFYGDGQGETTGHNDDSLWYILAVTEYIKETGDKDILYHKEKFLDGKESTILEHLYAVVKYASEHLGKHNLPIFGRGDWNDTLDYIGGEEGGESVWSAMFYVAMLNSLVELLSFYDIDEKLDEIIELRDKIKNSIEEYAWDGNWYIRAFKGNGEKLGASNNEAGKIFLNPQSWAVIASVGNRERLLKATDSVKELLDTDYGIKICAPAFREIDPEIGLVTRCVAGKKENAAVFCHPYTWGIMAECILKRGNRAYEYYKKILPNRIDSDIFQAEPYVFSQYITSDEHPTAGMASHSWQTGTAAWMFKISIEYILGIRPTYEGLLIDPVIPSEWGQFYVERFFRNTLYKITVENPNHVESGVKEIYVNGKHFDKNVVHDYNKVCEVKVVMG